VRFVTLADENPTTLVGPWRRLLEELAASAGVPDPAGLAAQVHLLVEGAVVGALVDRQPQVAKHARELTELALASARSSGHHGEASGRPGSWGGSGGSELPPE
jgi:hypothetical protein